MAMTSAVKETKITSQAMGSQNYDTIESWYFKAPVAVPGVLGNKEAGGKGMGGSYP